METFKVGDTFYLVSSKTDTPVITRWTVTRETDGNYFGVKSTRKARASCWKNNDEILIYPLGLWNDTSWHITRFAHLDEAVDHVISLLDEYGKAIYRDDQAAQPPGRHRADEGQDGNDEGMSPARGSSRM